MIDVSSPPEYASTTFLMSSFFISNCPPTKFLSLHSIYLLIYHCQEFIQVYSTFFAKIYIILNKN